jgi:hypothetical protein
MVVIICVWCGNFIRKITGFLPNFKFTKVYFMVKWWKFYQILGEISYDF